MARAAAVSRQAVSNVLNGSGRVGDAARARVLDAVATLGYHPHHGARSLRSRLTRQFAYVLPRVQLFPGNYIMQQFLQSLAAASAQRGYSMVIVVPDGDPRDDIRRLIASRSVDAFLLSELQPEDPRVVQLAEAGMAFACFGRTSPGLPQNWVDIDNRAAVAAVVEHVLARGFRRIAFLGYRSANHWDMERMAGFRAGLASHGISANQELLVDDTSARRKVRSLLAASQPDLRPDAIVTGSDRLAGVVYSVAAELRLRIGQDLAVTGFDGSAAGALMHPRLTSVAMPVDDIARRVVTRPSTVVRVASALAVLQEQGYDAIVYNVNSPLERDRHLEALLPTHRANGVLAVCLPLSRDQLDQFFRAGIALVSVDAANPGVPQAGYRRRGRRAAGDRPPYCPGASPDRLRRRHAVRAAARGEGPPAAAGTADRADGTGQFGGAGALGFMASGVRRQASGVSVRRQA